MEQRKIHENCKIDRSPHPYSLWRVSRSWYCDVTQTTIILTDYPQNISEWVTCVFPPSSSWFSLVNYWDRFMALSLVLKSNILKTWTRRWWYRGFYNDTIRCHQCRQRCHDDFRISVPLQWRHNERGEFPTQRPVTRRVLPFEDVIIYTPDQ